MNDETELADAAEHDLVDPLRWADQPRGWVDPRLPVDGHPMGTDDDTGRALAYAVYAVAGLALVVLLPALWMVSPVLVVLLAAAPAGAVLIGRRLRAAGRRLDQIIDESTTREGDADG